jgi:hypothetical protein
MSYEKKLEEAIGRSDWRNAHYLLLEDANALIAFMKTRQAVGGDIEQSPVDPSKVPHYTQSWHQVVDLLDKLPEIYHELERKIGEPHERGATPELFSREETWSAICCLNNNLQHLEEQLDTWAGNLPALPSDQQMWHALRVLMHRFNKIQKQLTKEKVE